ncbi:MAG: septation protein A [Alphaproteobacteria bacterium]|nr:septation protein A [Alphaproteobacteria bacterium]|tara:strand:- start:926 stop:1537 length:612 start_codon:yes stop_codon:yes gene_type:complete
MKNWFKLFIEAGPLIVFFVINGRGGLPELRNAWSTTKLSEVAQQALFEATGAFMLATIIALFAGWALERRLPTMPLVSGVFVIIFGGLTLILADETFIKIKPTLVNCLFSAVLIGGLVFKKSLLKPLFGSAFQLSEEGWRILTLRWGGFFILLAFLNEVIWRNFSTDFWISFKLFGILPLTLIFAVLQTPLVIREQDKDEGNS